MARHSRQGTTRDSEQRNGMDDHVVAQAIDLTKVYGDADNRVLALDHVNVEFERGQMTAIMGPSGSGKSTLMHCMAGLDQPTSGKVIVEGLEVSAMNQRQLTKLRREQIGFIFQSFNLVPTLSAEENILLPLQIAKNPSTGPGSSRWSAWWAWSIGSSIAPANCPADSSSAWPAHAR